MSTGHAPHVTESQAEGNWITQAQDRPGLQGGSWGGVVSAGQGSVPTLAPPGTAPQRPMGDVTGASKAQGEWGTHSESELKPPSQSLGAESR